MSTFLKEKEQLIQKLTGVINAFEGGVDTEEVKCLAELETELPGHPYVIWNKAALLMGRGEFPQAKALLLKLIKHSPFYFAAHFSLMNLFMAERELKKAFYHYTRAVAYAEAQEDRKFISEQLKSYIDELTRSKDADFIANAKDLFAITKKIQTLSYLEFPIDDEGTMVRKKIYEGRAFSDYLINTYKLAFIFSMGSDVALYVKHEMLEGKYCEGEAEFQKDEGDMFAFSTVCEEKVQLQMLTEEREIAKDLLLYYRFYYFNLPENGTIRFRSPKPYFIANIKAGKVPNKPELVLNIFIQRFSFAFLKEAGFEKIMPNTFKFFSDGYVAEKCITASEHSLSACMSLSSGKYAANHGLVHPTWNYNAEETNIMMQEYFYDAGYMTAKICGVYEMSPNYGYYKKNRRLLYAHNIGHFYADEVVAEAMEHLEAFDLSSNFLWLSIQDLCDIEPGFDNDPLAAVYAAELSDAFTAVEKRYLSQLKKIDFFLGVLYRFIERKYGRDKALVVLDSDVGPGFLSGDEEEKALKKLSVPFMMKGAKTNYLNGDALVSSVDILPTILDLCDIPANGLIDGQSVCSGRREFAYTDSIPPLNPYRATIMDKDGRFTFETLEATDVIGQAFLFNYKISDCEEGKAEAYTKLVYEHMKRWIKL